MEKNIIYDFDRVVSRAGTHAEKYDSRNMIFGKADVEPFWVADMDLPTPGFLAERLAERVAHPMFGYTDQYDEVFEAIVWWMNNQHGVTVDRKWISLSPSVVTTISLTIQAMTEPGDAVAVLSPVYGPFFTCTTVNGREVADCPMQIRDDRFEIDFDALGNLLSQPNTRLLLLCNPHNPGGRVWTRDELEQLVSLCAQHEVILFSDEIHCDIVYAPHRHQSVLGIEAASDICMVAHSIGKTFNTSGLQASFVMIPNPVVRSRFRSVQEKAHVQDVNLMGKVAIESALTPAGAEYKRQLNAYLRESTLQVCERLRALDRLSVMVPEATFLVWVDFREYGTWREVLRRLLHETNIGLSGGPFFGPAGEGWFRINCAHPRAPLLAATDRIIETFRETAG